MRHQGFVKLPMRHLPFGIVGVIVYGAAFDDAEPMDGRDYRYFPVISAIFDGATDQVDVDQNAGARQIDQIRDA